MITTGQIERLVQELDMTITALKTEKLKGLTMVTYHLDEARTQLVNLHFLLSTGQMTEAKEPTSD